MGDGTGIFNKIIFRLCIALFVDWILKENCLGFHYNILTVVVIKEDVANELFREQNLLDTVRRSRKCI